jgi:hypothetical protein
MACIRVRFVADSSFIGRAIRYVTGSLFQHVEFGTPEGTWIGAHSDGGIRERPATYCVPTREYVYEVPCTDARQATLLTWARSQIGVKYNLLDIAGLLFKARFLTSPNRFICSQFCTDGLLMVFGAKRVLNVLSGYAYLVTPETLHLSPIFVGNLVKRKG